MNGTLIAQIIMMNADNDGSAPFRSAQIMTISVIFVPIP